MFDNRIDSLLNHLPKAANGAVNRVGANIESPAVFAAELSVIKPPTETMEDIADFDVVGGPSKGIATRLPSGTGDESLFSQDHEELCRVSGGNAFEPGNLRDSHAFLVTFTGDLDEAPEPVFFLRGKLHLIET